MGDTSSTNWRISFTTESYNMPFSSQQVETDLVNLWMDGCKSELPNFSKDRTAEELRTILNYAHLCDDEEYVDDYNEEEMIKLESTH
ncbi:unnamed protein product [Rhizophagus irregularis]|nr:unnamed protein product [Rhizophagus irregularis]